MSMVILGAVQLQQRLNQNLKIDIKPGVNWVKPTPADLADWILDTLALSDPTP